MDPATIFGGTNVRGHESGRVLLNITLARVHVKFRFPSHPLEPLFLNSMKAIASFFKINHKCVSDLGSSLKHIIID
jgi:hypothetical protein